jgi:HlyD family secretion protein
MTRVWYLVCAAVCSFLPAGCGTSAPDLGSAPSAIHVETAPVRMQTIENIVDAQGLLYPIRQASLSPKISAPVRTFYVNRGSHVHAGELLAVLDNRDLAAGLVSAKGSYDQAQAAYATTTASTLPETIQAATLSAKDAQASLNEQQQLYASESNLYKQGALARRQLDATEVALTAAKSAAQNAQKKLKNLESSGATQARRAAKGQLEAAHGQYLGAAAQFGYTQLRSPISGVVAERAVYPGDIAPAGTPLLIVMDASKVIARLHVPEAQAALLHLGDAATLHVPGSQATVPGKVTVISPAVDPNSTTVEVWVQADNPEGELHPGGALDVTVVAQKIHNALVVPQTAILSEDSGRTDVMVVYADSVAHTRTVTTGVQQGSVVQIRSGLQAGEQVIVSGGYGLPDKTKVDASPQSDADEGLSAAKPAAGTQ